MPNDRKNMNQDQKNKNPQQQKPDAERDPQGAGGANREPQKTGGQQGQQQGPRGGDRQGVRQARQAHINKGSSNVEHEGNQQQVGDDGKLDDDKQGRRGNDLEDASGEITEGNPRHGKTDTDKDRR